MFRIELAAGCAAALTTAPLRGKLHVEMHLNSFNTAVFLNI
jgi:hypothetical protein